MVSKETRRRARRKAEGCPVYAKNVKRQGDARKKARLERREEAASSKRLAAWRKIKEERERANMMMRYYQNRYLEYKEDIHSLCTSIEGGSRRQGEDMDASHPTPNTVLSNKESVHEALQTLNSTPPNASHPTPDAVLSSSSSVDDSFTSTKLPTKEKSVIVIDEEEDDGDIKEEKIEKIEKIENVLSMSPYIDVVKGVDHSVTSMQLPTNEKSVIVIDDEEDDGDIKEEKIEKIENVLSMSPCIGFVKESVHEALQTLNNTPPNLVKQLLDRANGNGITDVEFESMETLKHGIWLNDEVINHYLKDFLTKRDNEMCELDAGRRRSHFFSSFFIQNMFDEKNKNIHLRGKYNYDNVRRWGKKVPGGDVFNLKYIVCPVNIENMHWCCAVIFMEEKRIQYYDSMRGTDKGKMEGLLNYLKDEYKKNHDDMFDASGWALVDCSGEIYCQQNGKF